jgi:hypothetical protein
MKIQYLDNSFPYIEWNDFIRYLNKSKYQDLRKDTYVSVNIGKNYQKYIIYRSNT